MDIDGFLADPAMQVALLISLELSQIMPDICSHPSLLSSHECCRQSDACFHGDWCPILVFCFCFFVRETR